MTNNERIAHQYARVMAAQVNKCWISDNLPQLDRRERKKILAVYQQYFKTVEYDPKTGICRCWVDEPEDTLAGTVGKFNSLDISTGIVGSPIKQSTLDAVGVKTVVDAGTIIND